MAKWLCPCGNQIRSSGEIPNPQEWRVISDQEIDAVLTVDAGPQVAEQLLDQARFAYRCERCDRLHVYWNGIGEWLPTVYVRDADVRYE